VGAYDSLAADATRGFLLERGRFTTVHVPGAKSTQVQGINNRGRLAPLRVGGRLFHGHGRPELAWCDHC
jgi:hypothetical protein